MTLSFENIIVLCIIFVMSLVLSYSLGVEKGKKTAQPAVGPVPGAVQTARTAMEPEPVAAVPESEDTAAPPEEVIQIETVAPPAEVAEAEAEAEAMPVTETAESSVERDYFTIQVASFKLEKNAHKEADRLKDIGYDIFVLAKGDYSIVCVGKFIERQQALEFSSKLKKRYNDCLVRRL